MRILSIFLLVCVTFSGCVDEGNEPPGQLTARTDKATYINGEFVRISVANATDFSAYVPSCCNTLAFYIDRFEDGSWRESGGYGIPCLFMCPGIQIVLMSGNAKTEVWLPADRGTYRLRVPYGRSIEHQMTEEVISNTFVIE
jgi:hypothetical protein